MTETNAGTQPQHGNDDHYPSMQPKGAPKSIPFHALPLDAMQQVIANRNTIRNHLENGITNASAIQAIQRAILMQYHIGIDSPEMNGDALLAAIQADPDYREIAALMQTYPVPDDAHYLTNRGPDIEVSGTSGSVGTTNETWYPPKETEMVTGDFMETVGQTASADIAHVSTGSRVYLVILSDTDNASDFTAPSGWTKLAVENYAPNANKWHVFSKTRQSGDPATASVSVASGRQIRGMYCALSSWSGQRIGVGFGSDTDEDNYEPRAGGIREYPRGYSFRFFALEEPTEDITFGAPFTEFANLGSFAFCGQRTNSSDRSRYQYVETPYQGDWATLTINTIPRKKTKAEALEEANLS